MSSSVCSEKDCGVQSHIIHCQDCVNPICASHRSMIEIKTDEFKLICSYEGCFEVKGGECTVCEKPICDEHAYSDDDIHYLCSKCFDKKDTLPPKKQEEEEEKKEKCTRCWKPGGLGLEKCLLCPGSLCANCILSFDGVKICKPCSKEFVSMDCVDCEERDVVKGPCSTCKKMVCIKCAGDLNGAIRCRDCVSGSSSSHVNTEMRYVYEEQERPNVRTCAECSRIPTEQLGQCTTCGMRFCSHIVVQVEDDGKKRCLACPEREKQRCSYPGCSNTSSIPVKCNDCAKMLCSKHRWQDGSVMFDTPVRCIDCHSKAFQAAYYASILSRCSHPGCSNDSPILVKCNDCSKLLCSDHRRRDGSVIFGNAVRCTDCHSKTSQVSSSSSSSQPLSLHGFSSLAPPVYITVSLEIQDASGKSLEHSDSVKLSIPVSLRSLSHTAYDLNKYLFNAPTRYSAMNDIEFVSVRISLKDKRKAWMKLDSNETAAARVENGSVLIMRLKTDVEIEAEAPPPSYEESNSKNEIDMMD